MKSVDKIKNLVKDIKVSVFKQSQLSLPTRVNYVGYSWQRYGDIDGDMIKRMSCVESDQVYLYLTKKAGQTKPHYHTSKEIGMVLRGGVTLKTPDKKIEVKSGGTYEVAPMVWHKLEMEPFTEIILFFKPSFDSQNIEAYELDKENI